MASSKSTDGTQDGERQASIQAKDMCIQQSTGFGGTLIRSKYRFAEHLPEVLEGAEFTLEMGASCYKFRLPRSPEGFMATARSPEYVQVFTSDIKVFSMWVNPPHGTPDTKSRFQEIHELAEHLLQTYGHTGKVFLLGAWEQDWKMRAWNSPRAPATKLKKVLDDIRVCQAAVELAPGKHPLAISKVFNYAEANLVDRARTDPTYECIANSVLPHVPELDYVSYSAYDYHADTHTLTQALDFLQSKLVPRPNAERRVFLGEFGFPLTKKKSGVHVRTEQEQRDLTLATLDCATAWRVPYAFYWQIYDDRYGLRRRTGEFTSLYHAIAQRHQIANENPCRKPAPTSLEHT